ncbi:MAG: hypothetical protein ACUVQ8_04185 [Nitrososphaeria archaeon]
MMIEIGLHKNHRLRKYEAIIEGIDVDIYVPYYSKLAIPVEFIMENAISIEGFKIPCPEVLLVLKQQAEMDRRNSVKGRKDRVDIISLLMNTEISWAFYHRIIDIHSLNVYPRELRNLVNKSREEFRILKVMNERKIKVFKKKILEEMSRIT